MTGFERIREALEKPLGIPVTAHVGDAKAPVYAVVHEMLEQPEQRADDRETLTGYYAQIDFIAKKNIEELVARANSLLAEAGFVRLGKRSEYSPEAKVFRHMLRVRLITEYEEG